MSESPPITPAPPEDLEQIRTLILASHTDIVPELIGGASISELVASITPAREAYNRVLASIPESPISIPAGGNEPVLVDADDLPTSEKIRRGLAASKRKD